MPKLDFDWDIMRQYNDKWILVYEWGYAEYEWETVWVWVAICKSWKWKEYFHQIFFLLMVNLSAF